MRVTLIIIMISLLLSAINPAFGRPIGLRSGNDLPAQRVVVETAASEDDPSIIVSATLSNCHTHLGTLQISIGEAKSELSSELLRSIRHPDLYAIRVESAHYHRQMHSIVIPQQESKTSVQYYVTFIDGLFVQIWAEWEDVEYNRTMHRVLYQTPFVDLLHMPSYLRVPVEDVDIVIRAPDNILYRIIADPARRIYAYPFDIVLDEASMRQLFQLFEQQDGLNWLELSKNQKHPEDYVTIRIRQNTRGTRRPSYQGHGVRYYAVWQTTLAANDAVAPFLEALAELLPEEHAAIFRLSLQHNKEVITEPRKQEEDILQVAHTVARGMKEGYEKDMALAAIAERYAEEGKYLEALNILDEAQGPFHPFSKLAMQLAEAGHHEKALSLCNAVIVPPPRPETGWNALRARLFAKFGDLGNLSFAELEAVMAREDNPPDAISEETAIEIALKSISRYNMRYNMQFDLEVTAEKRGGCWIIALEGPKPEPKPGYVVYDGVFRMRYYIDSGTGKVLRIVGGG